MGTLDGLTDLNAVKTWRNRSEEHTSELQSQSNLVCRLLLEKKNIKRFRGEAGALLACQANLQTHGISSATLAQFEPVNLAIQNATLRAEDRKSTRLHLIHEQ